MTQPFDDKDVLIRFVPTQEERKIAGSMYAEEWVITESYSTYFAFWQKQGGIWFQASALAFIPRLLFDRAKQEQKFAMLTEELDATEADNDTLIAKLAIAEQALEIYAKRKSWATMFEDTTTLECWEGEGEGHDLARTALAEIRTEKK